jgi:cell division protein FtsI (penicillin-binding protein 3)/stage V sporulation protein D (sporulation-specific penicillin-binding protein)
MFSSQVHRRMFGLASGLVLAFAALLVWLGRTQLQPRRLTPSVVALPAAPTTLHPGRRGCILDCRGCALAVSVPVKTVCADPSLIFTRHEAIARTLAPRLGLREADLLALLRPRLRTNAVTRQVLTNAYVVLKHKVPLDQWQQITQAMARLDLAEPARKKTASERLAWDALRHRAVFGIDDHRREYPNRTLAAHVVGFVASGEVNTDHGRVFEDHGVSGIEQTFDQPLGGVHGWTSGCEAIAPQDGANVVLTLDTAIQAIVEDELARAMAEFTPVSACAVAIDPRSGNVLALANAPNFDPNQPGAGLVGARNRAISDLAEPGSTFKIVTITSSIDAGVLSLSDTVFCENGRWFHGGAWLHDVHPYGILSYDRVVAKSSNIGTAKAALRLGTARLYHAVTNFGFGARSGLPLPAEAAGVIRPTNLWSRLSLTRVPIGQEVSASPLQMVFALGAIARGGWLMQPRLVDRLEDGQGRVIVRYPTNQLRRVASEFACREMVRALKLAVSKEGTASAAQLEHYHAAGKTGTAEKFVNGTYKSGKYYASFIGFFPVEEPAVCLVVAVDEPDKRVAHMGGSVAAPVFKAIAERVAAYLHLPPEREPEPAVLTEVAARRAYAHNRKPGAPDLAAR